MISWSHENRLAWIRDFSVINWCLLWCTDLNETFCLRFDETFCILEKDCNLEQFKITHKSQECNYPHSMCGLGMRPLIFSLHILWVMSLWNMPSLLSTANIKLSTSLELRLVWGWDCTSTRCCMTYFITVCMCAVLKRILHMLTYCNKLSLIIKSLPAAKKHRLFTAITAGCLPL